VTTPGYRGYAEAFNGPLQGVDHRGDGTVAESGYGNVNLAWTGVVTPFNADNAASAQYGNGNLAAIWGNGNTARAGGTTGTGNNSNVAVVAGQFSTATAGPGSNNRVVVLGFNKNQSKPAAAASARAARQH
jgi:hypothetical protein